MWVLTDEGRAVAAMLTGALRWLAGGVVVLLAGEALFGVGFGGLPLAVALFGFGIVQRVREGRAPSCRVAGPRLRPLQVSALGVITAGLVLARDPLGGPAPLAAVSQFLLSDERIAVGLVTAGVAWLAVLSLSNDCRDDALLRAMGLDPAAAQQPTGEPDAPERR
jgi:hypothetical protein